MRRNYFPIIASALLFSFSSSAQEINFAQIGNTDNAPEYKDTKLLNELNTADADAYPYISADGLTLYFSQGGTVSESNLYVAKRATINDLFADVQRVSTTIPAGSISCWLTNDEKEIYYVNSSRLYHATRASRDQSFGQPGEILLDGISDFISGPSLTPSGNELYLYNHSGGEKKIIHMVRTSVNSFSVAGELNFPPGYLVNPGQLSKTGFEFYITLGNDDSEKLYRLSRKSTDDSFDNAVLINTESGSTGIDQPSVSGDGSVLVYVKSTGTWRDNELGISTSDVLRSTVMAGKYGASLDVYPNPFAGTATLSFRLDKGENVKIGVYSLTGIEVAVINEGYMSEGQHTMMLDAAGLKQGTYVAKLFAGDKIRTQRVVVTD